MGSSDKDIQCSSLSRSVNLHLKECVSSLSLPTEAKPADNPGLLEVLYQVFFGGHPSAERLVFQTKGKAYKVCYHLPADRLARQRYRLIYSRILMSLRFK